MNAFDTAHYIRLRQRMSAVFDPAFAGPLPEKREELGEGYAVQVRFYTAGAGKLLQYPYSVRASESRLLAPDGRELYTWRNLHNNGDFRRLIRHKNGRHYLVFRRDLYGYSVLEVETGRTMHYVPAESYPERQEDFRETFIWTDAHYDPDSSLLAAPGCYWASTNSAVVIDFSHPLIPQERWLELHEVIDPDYDRYDDLDFVAWDREKGMLLRGFSVENCQYESLSLSVETIRAALARKS